MTNRWWRAYDEALDDPKIQRLTGDQFKAWFNLMCLASKHGGRLPGMFEIAFALRTNEQRAASALTELVTFRLFERDGDGYAPHNWKERQYQSNEARPGSYVYFIGSGSTQVVKVGISKNPWARIMEIQTSNHEKMKVIATFKTSASSEVDLHSIFAPHRVNGEWFDLPAEVMEVVAACHLKKTDYDGLLTELRSELRSEQSVVTTVVIDRSPTADTKITTTETEEDSESEKKEESIWAVGEKAPTRPSIRTRCEELFEELWKAKPRRDGANPRKPAFEKFGRLVDGRKAADWELATRIIAGAERWAAEETRRGVIGTDKVAQLITWLNQARWEGYPAQEAASTAPAGFYAAFGSAELDAWDAYRTDFEGRKYPRDKRGGWTFPTQWPAGYEPKSDVTVTDDDTPTIGR